MLNINCYILLLQYLLQYYLAKITNVVLVIEVHMINKIKTCYLYNKIKQKYFTFDRRKWKSSMIKYESKRVRIKAIMD